RTRADVAWSGQRGVVRSPGARRALRYAARDGAPALPPRDRRSGRLRRIPRGIVSDLCHRSRVHAAYRAAIARRGVSRRHRVGAPGDEASFLAPLPLRSLPGLGPATETALSGLGIRTLGELAALPLELVQRRVGNVQGRSIWERARGVDESPVTVPGRPRSVSREETFARDLDDRATLGQRLADLSADVASRLRAGAW